MNHKKEQVDINGKQPLQSKTQKNFFSSDFFFSGRKIRGLWIKKNAPNAYRIYKGRGRE